MCLASRRFQAQSLPIKIKGSQLCGRSSEPLAHFKATLSDWVLPETIVGSTVAEKVWGSHPAITFASGNGDC